MTFMLYLKSHRHTHGHRSFSPMSSSWTFTILHFIFRSMMICLELILWKIHFELIFMKSIRSVSRFIFFACGCPVVPASFVEKHLLHLLPLLLCWRLFECIYGSWHIMRVYFWAFYYVPFICLSILLLRPHCIDYCPFIISLEVRQCCPSDFFSPSVLYWLIWVFCQCILTLESVHWYPQNNLL